MSDLPDYQRNIQVVAGDIDVAEYDAAPEDISDGERGPFLVDIKGRLYTLADLLKIAGVDVATEVSGKLPVTSDLRKVKGTNIADTLDPGTVPIELYDSRIGYSPCYSLFWVGLSPSVDNYVGAYGHLGELIKQKATTFELLTYDSYVAALLAGGLPSALDSGALKIKEQSPLSALKIWDGTNYLATPGVGDAIGRGVFMLGSDYATPTPTAKVVKVDSSGRLSCVLG